MKTKELTSLRAKSTKDLLAQVEKKRGELLAIIAGEQKTKSKNLKIAMNLRKDIAQLLTLVREMELAGKTQEVVAKAQPAKAKK